MYAAHFDYVRAGSIDEAVALLKQHGDDAKVLAGGHSLIPAMKLRLARPTIVVDIGRIAGLSYVREAAGAIAIGAMTTHYDIETSALLQQKSPLLAETAAHIGDMQVRNKGTIGGSLVHADPAADYPAAVLALDAEIDLVGSRGNKRTVKAADFFVSLLQSAAAPGEILTEVRVPATAASVAYVKTEQKASGFALCGVAVVTSATGVRVGVTGVAATPYRAAALEQALGTRRTAEAIALAASHAADGVEPLGDIHASPEYRAHLARVNARRALERALAR
ncbi:MAG TPA: FAD binding domain-containing protein [Vicinamibacterales bacterium]|nr:FAD binding domain-containing protein [Vicinamibacterales bacterium]